MLPSLLRTMWRMLSVRASLVSLLDVLVDERRVGGSSSTFGDILLGLFATLVGLAFLRALDLGAVAAEWSDSLDGSFLFGTKFCCWCC